MGIASLFKQTASKFPDKVAIEFEAQRVTFREIDLQGNRVANAFQSMGIVKGDRVAQYLPNCLELVYSLIGNFKNGSIVVPMNASFKEQEILHILSDSGSKAIVTDLNHLNIIKNIENKIPNLKFIILVDGNDNGTLNFNELAKNAPDNDPNIKIADNDYSIIFYTSGTTGKPKELR